MITDLKINIIKKSKNFSIDDTHAYLTILGLPTDNDYGRYHHSDYLSQSIKDVEDEEILTTLMNSYEADNNKLLRTWKAGHYRIFISHRSEHKKEVSELKDYLLDFGIDMFVAHEDISVSVEWRDALNESLKTMHCLVAYITDDFFENDWCSQEVGFACISGARIIPMKVEGIDPRGFLSFFQAVNASTMTLREKASFIIDKLLEIDSEEFLHGMISALDINANFSKTKEILELIYFKNIKLPKSLFLRLEEIYASNGQVSGYYHSEKYINKIKENSGIE